ncbi:MAG: hypothetical protein ACXWD3_10305 [Mycobacterium sp.]
MHDPTRIRRVRGLAVALSSVVVVSSTAFGAGAFPALAQPTDETTIVETPVYEAPPVVEAPPVYEAPPVVEAPPVPAYTPEAPVVTEVPPVVTEAPPVVTQEPVTTAAPAVTQEPEVVTTEAAPIPTPTGALPTPTGPLPTPSAATTAATPTTGSTSGTSTSPSGSAALETSTSATSGTSTTATSEGSTSTSATGSEDTSSGETTADGSTEQSAGGPSGETSGESAVEDTGSIEPAAGVTTTPEPQRAEASLEDIAKAQDAKPVEQDPPPAAPAEIDNLKNLILDPEGANSEGGGAPPANASLAAAEQRVLQWQPDWVQYDKYYRPLIFNPYPEPLQLVYDVGGVPRLVLIPPFGRMVTEVRDAGSYNFTALRLNALGVPIDFAVGNFFGGGYFPGPGLPPPPPPPPVRTLSDVPVQVKYASATYRPIVVRKIVDVGPDPAQGGAHKVLLDGVTPAWGEWKQNEQGVPQFEVNQTQSFPGMEAPGQGPLPGNYDMQLVSDSTPTGMSGKDITMIVAAVMAAAVGIGAIVLTVFLGRRRRPQH